MCIFYLTGFYALKITAADFLISGIMGIHAAHACTIGSCYSDLASMIELSRSDGPVGESSYFLGDPPPDPRFLASLGALSLAQLHNCPD